MAESIQAYYKKLIARQSDSIRKYLIKYGLTEWDMVSPTLTQKEREYILKRYREGIDFRAVSFFRKIVTRAQMNEAAQKKEVVGGKYSPKVRTDKGEKQRKECVLSLKQYNETRRTFIYSQESKRLFEILFDDLSIRAQNILLYNDLNCIEKLKPWIEGEKNSFLKYRNCGRRTSEELMEMVHSLRRKIVELSTHSSADSYMLCQERETIVQNESTTDNGISPNDNILTTDKDSAFPFEEIIHFDKEEQIILCAFKEEYGHWPMAFVLFSKIRSLLKPREFAAFEDRYGIRKHKELTRQWALQLFESANRKLQSNSSLKQLCDNVEWRLYNVNNILIPIFDNVDENPIWLEIETLITQEKYFLNSCFNSIAPAKGNYKKQLELLSHINLSTFKVFLQFWGHVPLWLKNNSIVPYCPQEKKGYYDPLSPIVIDKRFASFNFSKSIAEIGRLKKEKKANDIILSIEKYFVDNEDYWIRFVYLSKVDKASLVSILKKLFRDICNVNIADDNLVFKANRVDFSDKLYGILSIEGTRLHRDELFKRLKKTCEEQGVQCSFSKSSQITTFLTKDPRIIPYGKSSYWGLKEWGETYGSIRELTLRIMKESTEPIHIDVLTKLIMEIRPDSNEKSISSIIRQTTSTGELLLFWGDYIGYPNAKYIHEFILMPRSFDEWLKAFKEFVLNNKRYPSNDKGFEGFLNRWYQRAIKLTDLSAEEILKFDALEKELTHYPHNTIEYNFLHKCNLYKKFVEGNNRMLEETDDYDLFRWFNSASLNYSTFKDNRNRYFSQLLQYLSSKLY